MGEGRGPQNRARRRPLTAGTCWDPNATHRQAHAHESTFLLQVSQRTSCRWHLCRCEGVRMLAKPCLRLSPRAACTARMRFISCATSGFGVPSQRYFHCYYGKIVQTYPPSSMQVLTDVISLFLHFCPSSSTTTTLFPPSKRGPIFSGSMIRVGSCLAPLRYCAPTSGSRSSSWDHCILSG